MPSDTSDEYSSSAAIATLRKSQYCLVCLGTKSLYKPSMSWKTCTWPSHSGPAPIPIVGIDNFDVIMFAKSLGISSSTTA